MFQLFCEIFSPNVRVDPLWFPAFAVGRRAATSDYLKLKQITAAMDPEGRAATRFHARYRADLLAAVAGASGPAHLFLRHFDYASFYVEVAVIGAETRRMSGRFMMGSDWDVPEPLSQVGDTFILASSIGETVVRRLLAEGLFDWPSPHGEPRQVSDQSFELLCKWQDRCRYVEVWPSGLGAHGRRICRILGPWLRRPGPRLKLASWWHGLRHDRDKRPGQTGSTDAADCRTW